MLGCAEIADGIPAKAKLCRNSPLPQIAFPEQPKLFSLLVLQQHLNRFLKFNWNFEATKGIYLPDNSLYN